MMILVLIMTIMILHIMTIFQSYGDNSVLINVLLLLPLLPLLLLLSRTPTQDFRRARHTTHPVFDHVYRLLLPWTEDSVLLCSARFYTILLYSILLDSILFYSILLDSIPFCSILVCYIPRLPPPAPVDGGDDQGPDHRSAAGQ